jgi:hypothetical protein
MEVEMKTIREKVEANQQKMNDVQKSTEAATESS